MRLTWANKLSFLTGQATKKGAADRMSTAPNSTFNCVPLRQNHAVDDVNHTVGRFDISRNNLRRVNHDAFVTDFDRGSFSVHGLRRFQFHHFTRENFPGDDVVSQDADQLLLVFRQQEALDSACWQLRECFIGGSENCEWSFALQGVDQPGSGLRARTERYERLED